MPISSYWIHCLLCQLTLNISLFFSEIFGANRTKLDRNVKLRVLKIIFCLSLIRKCKMAATVGQSLK